MYNAWVGTVFNSRCDSIYEAPTTLADDLTTFVYPSQPRYRVTELFLGQESSIRAISWPVPLVRPHMLTTIDGIFRSHDM